MMPFRFALLTLLASFTMGQLCVDAQETATAEAAVEQADLPDGKQIYADFLEATGGREARSKVETQRMIGNLKMEIPGAGEVEAPIQVYQLNPNKFQLIVDFSEMGAGELNQGTNGEIAWEVAPQGTRILQGAQKERMMRQADTEASVNPELRYKSIKCVSQEDQDGRTLYRVEFLPKDEGAAELRLFDAESKLMVGTITKQESGFGPIAVQTSLSDYREVDGLKIAFRNEMKVNLPMGEQKQVMEFEKVEINGNLPDEAFAVPEAIQKLIAEQETAGEES